ncbi:MAG: hypothetical protein R2774_09990 [Saprospiraceae bacterium]
MNIEFLLTVIDDLIDDENENKINEEINKLKTFLTQSKGNQPNAGTGINNTIKLISEKGNEGNYGRFTRGYFKLLEEMKGSSFFGDELLANIDNIFSNQKYSIDKQVAELEILRKNRTDFFTTIAATKANLEKLHFQGHYQDELFEVGIIIPDLNELHYAKNLEETIHNWNLIIKSIKEIQGLGTEDIKVERVHNGCIELIIEQVFSVAEVVGEIVSNLVTIYLAVDKVRTHLAGLKENGIPDKDLKPIEDSQSKFLESEIDKLASELVKKMKDEGLDDGREKELKVQLKNGIKYIAKSLEKGVEVEIIPPYLSPGDTEPKKEDTPEKKAEKLTTKKKDDALKKSVSVIKEMGTILKKTKDLHKDIFKLIKGGEGRIDEMM